MCRLVIILLILVSFVVPGVSAEVDDNSLQKRALDGARKAVDLIDRTSATFLEARACFSCHTQSFAALVLTDAAKAGIDVNGKNLSLQVERAYEIYDSLDGVRPDTVGHALFTLDVGQHPPNEKTDAMLRYLLDYDKASGHWKVDIEDREPAESSHFATNYLALRAANRYGNDKTKHDIATRRNAVEEWFKSAEASTTEDQVFRLFLAQELDVPEGVMESFVGQLLDEQRDDGGWAQQSDMQSDAYATASALVALNKVGGISRENEKWQNGVKFLLDTQRPDGSWHVSSRVEPIQEYFESGFPHGKDQFISAFATGWGAEALLIHSGGTNP